MKELNYCKSNDAQTGHRSGATATTETDVRTVEESGHALEGHVMS